MNARAEKARIVARPLLSVLLVACGGAPSERAAPRVDAPSLDDSLEVRRRADLPAPTECWNERDCPMPRHCIGFNRNGEDTFRADETVPFREWRRLCVGACASDDECPTGFACLGHAEYIVLPTERDEGRVETYSTCAPLPPSGGAARGAECTRDDDCGAEAPYCMDSRCASPCAQCPPDCPECPDGETCRRVQSLANTTSSSLSLCVRAP